MNNIQGCNLVIDSNIIIYYFADKETLENPLTNIIEDNYLNISIMSEIEVLGFDLTKEQHN